MKAGNKRGLKKLKHKETTSADEECTKEPRAKRSKATSKQQSRAAAQQGNEAFDAEEEGGFDAEEQEPTPAVAKQVRLIVAGGVVVLVLVQIKLLEKALLKAQKELARVLTANKGLKEKAGRLEKGNRVLEAEGATASKQLLQLEEELLSGTQEMVIRDYSRGAPWGGVGVWSSVQDFELVPERAGFNSRW